MRYIIKLSPLSALEPVGGEEGEVNKINLFITISVGTEEGLGIDAEPIKGKLCLFFDISRPAASFGPL